jgi:DNA segregation ATPase FtsK/SpoIIIE, S-DNA-T family
MPMPPSRRRSHPLPTEDGLVLRRLVPTRSDYVWDDPFEEDVPQPPPPTSEPEVRPIPRRTVQRPLAPPPAAAPASEALPVWKRPFSLPPNVRFTRTPDAVLRPKSAPQPPAEPEPADSDDMTESSVEDTAPPESGGEEEDVLREAIALPASLPDTIFWEAMDVLAGAEFEEEVGEDTEDADGADDESDEDENEDADEEGEPSEDSESSDDDSPDLAPPPLPLPARRRAARDLVASLTAASRRRIVLPRPMEDEKMDEGAEQDVAEEPEGDVAETADEEPAPVIVKPARGSRSRPSKRRKRAAETWEESFSDYEYPPLSLLAEPRKQSGSAISAEALEANARLLEGVLEDFGVRGEIIHVRPGPVVTLYELEPAPGIKSSRVIGLADDIARSMSALSARVAVVPGRNVIGIELPNHKRETVYFRELIGSQDFEASKFKLALCLGKTIGGEPVIAELAKMPQLLVAGTTGSGKSVAINTMILSLLYRLKPEECRLIMVDPKMLELSVYDGIPHLLSPVVTDPKKAVLALKWAVREMEERYKTMSKLGVRNIDGYNQRAAEARASGETVMRTVQTGFDRETGEALYEQEAMELSPMPYIVVIVDEMADLMMVAGKDIEGAIQRLAQMARAAGIHLIMATQRPSVDVITGTIKANFPTRISFQVTSKIDSRTILGEQGAEQLLGQGDMLHMAGGGRISRVHGPFVSDDEVEKVVAHLKAQGRPDYLDAVTAGEDEEGEAGEDGEDGAAFDKGAIAGALGEDSADLYEQAVKVVLRDKKCSTSYIQRRLQIGYNRAASLVERMEKEGLVGPANHAGKREILASSRDRVIHVDEEEMEEEY